MKKFIFLFIAFLIFPIANAACLARDENTTITESTIICPGIYNFDIGIRVLSDNIVLECNNSALIGNGIGFGILLKDRKNITVRNCNISNFEVGVYLDNTNRSMIINNYLTKNKFGIALFNSFNNDVNENFLSENIGNAAMYLPAPLFEEEKPALAAEKPEAKTPRQVLEGAIRIKNPGLDEEEILKEVNFIFDKYFSLARENLEIRRTVIYNKTDKSTRIALYLKPKKILLNVSVYEKIPKCVSSYANQILFEAAGYEVVEEDPLILWTLARVDKDKELQYKVLKKIDEECKNLLIAFGLVEGVEEFEMKEKEKADYLMLILVIALSVFLIIIFMVYRQTSSQN